MAAGTLFGTILLTSSASADVFDDAGCEAYALVDRKDGSTQTYGIGRISCDDKVLDSTKVDVKLYKNGGLRERGSANCGTPVHSVCAANTDLTSGSTGEWRADVTITARIGGEFNRTYSVSDTREW